ncbi:MAG: GHKL domain-containing protein [Clostridia bacterium]|nr:GHKL domain-containing protein [Clostridia bacterium]
MTVLTFQSVLRLIWILLEAANGYFLYRLCRAFVDIKERWIWKVIFFCTLCVSSGMIIWVGDNNLLFTLPVFLLCFMLSTKGDCLGRLTLSIIFFCFVMSVCAFLDTYFWRSIPYDIAVRIARTFVFAAFYFALRHRFPAEPAQVSRKLWKLILGLSAMPLCALIAVVLLTYQKYESSDVYTVAMNQGVVVLPFVLITSFLLLNAVLTLADYERLEQANRLASLREIYYQGLRREQSQVRILRHDLRNHLTVLQGLIEESDLAKARDYLEQIGGSPALQGSRRLCENEVANAVLSAKAEEMDRKGLDRDFQISLQETIPIADMDLCALLGNALDNAMEAAVKAEDKRISVRCRIEKGMLMLKVTNELAGDEKTDFTTTKQDKKNHGFGLVGMREIATRYGGSLDATAVGSHFELVVCLPI